MIKRVKFDFLVLVLKRVENEIIFVLIFDVVLIFISVLQHRLLKTNIKKLTKIEEIANKGIL